ncbi:hypothetical protein CDL15_Pgr024326 [Punica granatum]|uniref:Uncharacterized protein n=1 Tax=Punica granatum TaxID=22663 RepID=A0A218XXT2_PUNGR|nr:hypothetical protein CDL15_Pgr024326 [Punica granatum]
MATGGEGDDVGAAAGEEGDGWQRERLREELVLEPPRAQLPVRACPPAPHLLLLLLFFVTFLVGFWDIFVHFHVLVFALGLGRFSVQLPSKGD